MKTIKVQKVLILVSLVAGVLAAGCELIVDFDRTKIQTEVPDTGSLVEAGSLGDGEAPAEAGGDDGGLDGSDETDADASDNEDAGDAGAEDADADAG